MAILVIVALGVTVLTGIYATCQDMYRSADRFYDEQHLFDIRVLSTLGLTQEDVDALQAVDGIAAVDGGYIETVYTQVNDVRQTADMTVLSAQGMNQPYVLEGTLPAKAGEIAVTQAYIDASGKGVGDTIVIEEKLEENEEEGPAKAEDTKTANAEGEETDTDVEWDTEVDIEQEEAPTFPRTGYTITAVVLDPMDISSNDTAFRSTVSSDYTFFITPEDVDTDVFTAVYITLAGTQEMNCYSAEYEETVQEAVRHIETQIMEQREQARYQAVIAEALDKLTDAEATMNEKFEEADAKFADAWADIEDAKKEIIDGEAELTQEEKDALQKLADARQRIEDGKRQLADAQAEITAGKAQLDAGEAQLNAEAEKLQQAKQAAAEGRQNAQAGFAAAEQVFADEQAKLDAARGQVTPGIEQLKQLFGADWPEAEWNTLVGAATAASTQLIAADPGVAPDPADVAAATSAEQTALADAIAALNDPALTAMTQDCINAAVALGIVEGGQQVLDGQRAAYEQQKQATLQQLDAGDAAIAAGEAQIEEKRAEIAALRAELEDGQAQVDAGWAALMAGETQLNEEEAKALKELAKAWRELADGKQELAEGQEELEGNEREYARQRAEAEQKIADAYAEIEDIDMTQWYVQDRSALSSYASMKSDMGSIEAVGNAFPVVFLVVAILISLTTMTRMVEEDRSLIGTYKALGFSRRDIYRKYLLYALLACLFGGILGDLLGFIVLPLFLSTILEVMYTLPYFLLRFDVLYGVGGVALFAVSIVGATALTCRKELAQMPAALMRPKAPKVGSRVLLERIPAIWNRLGFLNKVTMRNLFRYKKRLFMTVAGIMGCTALVLAGLAIKDSVTDLMPKQYEQIYQYDLMVVTDSEDNDELLALLERDGITEESLNLQIETVKAINAAGEGESVQLMVVPTGGQIEEYISLPNLQGAQATLDDQGILLTQNAAELLGLEPGDAVQLQNLQLDQYEVKVSDLVENYLGNTVFITQELYESTFGEYKPNGVLALLSDAAPDQAAYAKQLMGEDIVLSAVSTQALRADFSDNFALINSVVYVLILLAAGLAFVVLFTLSNTNISERERELATIKVLGFFNREVHSYINKETLILTVMGVLIGLPVGRWISGLLTEALKMPSLYFAVSVHPVSYVIAGVLSFSFALVVNLMTNRTLNRIDMVEALKSVE